MKRWERLLDMNMEEYRARGISGAAEGTLSYIYFPTGKVETMTSSNSNGASVTNTYNSLGQKTAMVTPTPTTPAGDSSSTSLPVKCLYRDRTPFSR
ncbi:MAG: hypothetical protein WAK26_00830 [Terracidiphilus sp.]